MKSCRKILEARVHQPLQIRTYKHRCFVFCPEQTSLICVPGIGKKNEILLHRIGINDLAHLFVKYRQINDIQRFRQWLQTHVGFSFYQSKMTTCAVASKLGDIHEIDTGLKPICCPSKRFKLTSSLNDDDDLFSAVATKREDLRTVPIDDRSTSSTEKIFENRKSHRNERNVDDDSFSPIDHLTDVKSSNGEIYAGLSSRRKKSNNSFDVNNEKKIFDHFPTGKKNVSRDKHNEQRIPHNKTTATTTTNVETSQSLDFNRKEKSQTKNNEDDLIKIEENSNDFSILRNKSNIDDHSNAIVPHSTDRRQKGVIDAASREIPSTNSTRSKIDPFLFNYAGNSDTKTNQISNSISNDQIDHHSILSNQNDSTIKSILRSNPSKSMAYFSPETLLATIKERDKGKENEQTDRTSRSKTNENFSLIENNSRSISSLKRSYASLPLSTPATFPIRGKMSKNSETSSLFTSNIEKDERNKRKSPTDSSWHVSTPMAEQSFLTESNGFNSEFHQKNDLQMKRKDVTDENVDLYREIDKTVNFIMEEALSIAKDQGRSSHLNVMTLKNSTVTDTSTSPISLAERFARVEAKKFATFEALTKEAQRTRQLNDEFQLNQHVNKRHELNNENLSTTNSSDNNVTNEIFSPTEKDTQNSTNDETKMTTTFETSGETRSDYKSEKLLETNSSRSAIPSFVSVTVECPTSSIQNPFDPWRNEDQSASSLVKSHIDQHDNDEQSKQPTKEIIKSNESQIDIDVPPIPRHCASLWDQISDEKLLLKRQNHRTLLTNIRK